MNHKGKVCCVLCLLSQEDRVTGALSTKDSVTAHQNCLLFASGIYCKNTPEFDDLFGFSVEDVVNEVKRGKKLFCRECKKYGATAGCEVKRCKKTYHYPCAVLAGAESIEDEERGNYVLYCHKDYQQLQSKQGNKSADGLAPSFPKPTTSRCSNKAGSTKRRTSDDTTAPGASVYSSDSNSSSSVAYFSSKRRQSDSDKEEEMPSKRKYGGCKRRIIDDFPNSDDHECDTQIGMYAPLESDLDDSANSVENDQLNRTNTETPAGSTSGHRQERKDEDEPNMPSDAESESLLCLELCNKPQSPPSTSDEPLPLTVSNAHLKVTSVEADDKDQGYGPDQHKPGPSVPRQSSTEPPPSPALSKSCRVTGSPSRSSTAISPTPPEAICVVPLSSSPFPPPVVHPIKSDSVSFWKSCNAAGCTEAIFAGFIHEMNEISSRIRSEQASQEDYDLALKVITDSGKLTQLVTKQQQELQRKLTELTKAAAAMNEVVSALKR